MPVKLRVMEQLSVDRIPSHPEGFLRFLGGPTLFRVRGRDPTRTRAVATLIHGDEPSGLLAIQAWLRSGERPATDVVVFVGNVAAALERPVFTHRHRPGRPDLNRCFVDPCEHAEGALAREALARIAAARPEALVDLHNTTGTTPAFAIGHLPVPELTALARRFTTNFLASRSRALGSLVDAAGERFPSIVVECGRGGDPGADRVAAEGLPRYLGADDLWAPLGDGGPRLRVYERPVRIQFLPWVRPAAGSGPVEGADVTLRPGLDRLNFTDVPPGTLLGWASVGGRWPFLAMDSRGGDLSRELLEVVDGEVRVRSPFSAIMWTPRPDRALEDCLGYAVSIDGAGGVRFGMRFGVRFEEEGSRVG